VAEVDFEVLPKFLRSWDSAAGTTTGYGLGNQRVGVQVPVESRISSSPCHPEEFWGPSNLLSKVYGGSFHKCKVARVVKLTIHLQLVPR
jgi:hypothetical protein